MQRYKLSPAWSLQYEDGELILNGGADQAFSLELPLGRQSFFSGLKHGQLFTRAKAEREVDVFEQLLAAQIIMPVMTPAKKTALGIFPAAAAKLFPSIGFVPVAKADFIVYVRTNQTYADFLLAADYADVSKPHLFVDLAYNQTVSIGPLVFPGETACISCLQGRITDRWGDSPPPPAPRMSQKNLQLTESILQSELDRIFDDKDHSLINTTVSWDIRARSTDTHALLTVPFCPVCNRSDFVSTGKLQIW